jgi:hypothetical protein
MPIPEYASLSLLSGFFMGSVYGTATMIFRPNLRAGYGGPAFHVVKLGIIMSIVFLLTALILFSNKLMSEEEIKDFVVGMGFWLSGCFFLFELCRFVILNFLRRD